MHIMTSRPSDPMRPQAGERPLVRKDADGHERTAPSWETLVERLIREAQEAGRFDDLPGHGRPLALEDERHAGDLALAHHLLHNAGVAPPWIEADKEVRRIRSAIEHLLLQAATCSPGSEPRLRGRLDELVEEHDAAVRELEGLAPGPRLQRSRLDRQQLKARLDAVLAACDRP
jgi:hypothetical protein